MSVARFNFSHGSHDYHQARAAACAVEAVGPAARRRSAGRRRARAARRGDAGHRLARLRRRPARRPAAPRRPGEHHGMAGTASVRGAAPAEARGEPPSRRERRACAHPTRPPPPRLFPRAPSTPSAKRARTRASCAPSCSTPRGPRFGPASWRMSNRSNSRRGKRSRSPPTTTSPASPASSPCRTRSWRRTSSPAARFCARTGRSS